MARAVYSHELQDQDFSWLITKYQENNPQYTLIETSSLPLVLIKLDRPIKDGVAAEFQAAIDLTGAEDELGAGADEDPSIQGQ